MTLIIQSEAYIIGIEKALDDSERTVGSIIEPQKDGSLRVVATFNEAVASVIEQLDNKVRAAEQRVKEMEAKQQHISLKPQPLTLANETMDVERLREIVEEDNGSDVKFECSVMARMLLSVALSSDPVAYTDAEELESLEGVDGHSYAHLWPNSYGFGKDIALYTVPQMLPVNILDDETNRDVFEAWVADYTGHTKGFVRQFRVDDKYRSDSMWNKYWNTWNACRTAMLQGIRDLSQPVDPQVAQYEKIMLQAGWVMVPVEPTDEMIAAAMECDDVVFDSKDPTAFCIQFREIYYSMVTAAPKPEVNSEYN